MSTANNRTSARNSKMPTGMHNSASELMMKHARKEQMLVAEVVINIVLLIVIERDNGPKEKELTG